MIEQSDKKYDQKIGKNLILIYLIDTMLILQVLSGMWTETNHTVELNSC